MIFKLQKNKNEFVGKIENTFHACSVFLHTFVNIFTLHCCLASRSAKALTGNAYQSASSVFLVTTSTLHMSHTFPRHDSQLSRIGLKTCLFGVFSWERRPENLEKNPSFLGQLVDTTGYLRLHAIACDVGHKCCVVCVL